MSADNIYFSILWLTYYRFIKGADIMKNQNKIGSNLKVTLMILVLMFAANGCERTFNNSIDTIETISQSVPSSVKPAFLDTTPDLILTGPTEANTQYGNYPRFGDVNGDGYEDLLVAGASLYNNNQGRLYLYYGGADMDDIADIILTGENPGDYFGEEGYLTDVNGDGYADIITGAYGYNKLRGRLYIYFGGPIIDGEADLIIEGEAGTQGAFCGPINAGDINNDGFMDLVVCAPMYNNRTGRVYLFYGGWGYLHRLGNTNGSFRHRCTQLFHIQFVP